MAVHQLEAARRTHLQTHCQSCCHHSNATSDRHPAHVCGCRAAGNAEQDRVSQQIAHETLSFLQPPCAAGMAREQHQPFEWSLLMRAFASWKVCKACWRPPANTFARCHAVEVILSSSDVNMRLLKKQLQAMPDWTRFEAGALLGHFDVY